MGGGLVGLPALSGNFLPPTALAWSSPFGDGDDDADDDDEEMMMMVMYIGDEEEENDDLQKRISVI